MKYVVCDRCGCAFNADSVGADKIRLSRGNLNHTCSFYDLCGECQKDLEEWFEQKNKLSENVDVL